MGQSLFGIGSEFNFSLDEYPNIWMHTVSELSKPLESVKTGLWLSWEKPFPSSQKPSWEQTSLLYFSALTSPCQKPGNMIWLGQTNPASVKIICAFLILEFFEGGQQNSGICQRRALCSKTMPLASYSYLQLPGVPFRLEGVFTGKLILPVYSQAETTCARLLHLSPCIQSTAARVSQG